MEIMKDVYSIEELLVQINLKRYQKHPDFHIMKPRDHQREIPFKVKYNSKTFFEITFSRSEEAEIQIDQHPVEASKDHLLFLSPGQTLEVEHPEGNILGETFIVFFTADFLDFAPSYYHVIKRFPFFNMNALSVYYTTGRMSDLYIEYMQKLYREFQQFNPGNIEIIKALLSLLLFETKRNLDDTLYLTPKRNSRKAELTYRFENLIKQSDKKNKKLSEYAAALHISQTYLAECIKETTGKTAKAILTEYIVLEAKSLLLSTTDTIANIAIDLGFKDASNFINFYKKHRGHTPNQERKRHL